MGGCNSCTGCSGCRGCSDTCKGSCMGECKNDCNSQSVAKPRFTKKYSTEIEHLIIKYSDGSSTVNLKAEQFPDDGQDHNPPASTVKRW